jgi:hypothetical protein
MATKRKSVRISFALFSEIKGIKSLSFVPIAIPLFSTKSNLKNPQSTMGGTP